jgi:hypothetical protein
LPGKILSQKNSSNLKSIPVFLEDPVSISKEEQGLPGFLRTYHVGQALGTKEARKILKII